MSLAPSVHIATHFGQGISCSWKKLSITLKISELFLPPGSCLQNRNSSCISFWSTNHKKAERRLTHRWIHLIVVQNNLPSGVFRLLTSAANSSLGRALGCFSVFLRTHPSQTLFCTY